MLPRRVVAILLAIALLLPIVLVLLWGLAALLEAMADAGGAAAMRWIALALAVAWVVDLVAIVLALAIERLELPRDDEPPRE